MKKVLSVKTNGVKLSVSIGEISIEPIKVLNLRCNGLIAAEILKRAIENGAEEIDVADCDLRDSEVPSKLNKLKKICVDGAKNAVLWIQKALEEGVDVSAQFCDLSGMKVPGIIKSKSVNLGYARNIPKGLIPKIIDRCKVIGLESCNLGEVKSVGNLSYIQKISLKNATDVSSNLIIKILQTVIENVNLEGCDFKDVTALGRLPSSKRESMVLNRVKNISREILKILVEWGLRTVHRLSLDKLNLEGIEGRSIIYRMRHLSLNQAENVSPKLIQNALEYVQEVHLRGLDLKEVKRPRVTIARVVFGRTAINVSTELRGLEIRVDGGF